MLEKGIWLAQGGQWHERAKPQNPTDFSRGSMSGSPPGNNLESLTGDLKGYYSIRINDQWRIIFGWDTEPYDVRIVDYH
jgi:Txe/YoeB family toxin of Txe-Axe toxin-antitoxin module